MNEEQELRDQFWTADVPHSRIEVEAMVRAGRKQVARRRAGRAVAGAGLAAAVLVAVPSVLSRAGAQPAPIAGAGPASTSSAASPGGPCRTTELRVPSGMANAKPTAVDPTGRYIVGYSTKKQDFRPILWTDGKPQALPLIAESVQPTAVNASGVVVGLASNGQDDYVFRYENGQYTKLKTPPGKWHPYPDPAINADGDVVINAEPQGNVEGKGEISLLWKAGSTTATRLPLPAGADVYDIADDGTIVGRVSVGQLAVGYVWDQQGHGRKLETPAGKSTAAYAVEGDWATGGQWPDLIPALWNIRTGQRTKLDVVPPKGKGTLGQDPGPATAVNASGMIVAGGLVLRDGRKVALEVPSGESARAEAAADNGLVVGVSVAPDESSRPRTWSC